MTINRRSPAPIGVTCPNGDESTTSFPVYIDPAGIIVDTDGNLIEGATVTLWESPTRQGPLTVVPDGGAVMSPANRVNPMVTDTSGRFAWDVVTGYYLVTASKPGCFAAGTDNQFEARTPLLRVPPAVLDLVLILDCRPPDTTPPTLTITAQPGEYTNATSIGIEFAVSDNQPGAVTYCGVDEQLFADEEDGLNLPNCSSPYQLDGLADGPHEIAVFAYDTRDNPAVRTVSFTVDTVAPVIEIVGPGEASTVTLPSPTPTCTATDDPSGIAGTCIGTVVAPPSGVGTYTYTATATDRAGNTTTTARTWKVIYPFDGFHNPVENLPTLNQINAGRAIPIKFGLGGDRGLAVIATGWPKSVSVPCDTTSPIEAIDPTVAPGASTLSYSPGTSQYQYVWKTSKTWAGTCRQFTLRLADGTDHHLLFRFT